MTETPTEYQVERDQARFFMRSEAYRLYDEAFGSFHKHPSGATAFGKNSMILKNFYGSTIESIQVKYLVIQYISCPETRREIEAWLKNFPVTGRMAIAYLRGVVKANQRTKKLAEGGNDAGF